ncbi:hypothetical protein BRC68_05850 [Halobacteriales archaeon QH_6_64_20]|nr:MAG: hypothetical protein BRC68_05850 [Halobacteriales archaeon QH_6_64_20]
MRLDDSGDSDDSDDPGDLDGLDSSGTTSRRGKRFDRSIEHTNGADTGGRSGDRVRRRTPREERAPDRRRSRERRDIRRTRRRSSNRRLWVGVRGPHALVRSVAVEPGEQGNGYGTTLVERLFERARTGTFGNCTC